VQKSSKKVQKMVQAMPQLSIIIPTFQRSEKLKRALHSIFVEQPSNKVEVIVIDDCPLMSGASIVESYDNVIYLCKRGHLSGPANSRNMGIQFAQASHIVFLDDDDFLLEDSLPSYIDAAERNVSFFYGNHAILKNDELSIFDADKKRPEDLLIQNFLPVGSFMFRKSSLKSVFDPKMKSHEDWEFLLSNIDFSDLEHTNKALVCIDKGNDVDEDRKSIRVRHRYFADYMCVYARHPAPNLSKFRAMVLQGFGISVPPEALLFDQAE